MPVIVLVRHGETTGNSSIRLNGATDVPLSELGRRQAERARGALAGEVFDRLLVSPLCRSQQAGALAAPGLAAEVIPGFTEVDFGAWETWTWKEVAVRDPEGYAAWTTRAGDFQFPGGDSQLGFRDRVAASVEAHLAPSLDRVLCALHKGVIKVILSTLLERPFAEFDSHSVELGSIHRLKRNQGAWQLVAPGQVDHLGEDRCPGT